MLLILAARKKEITIELYNEFRSLICLFNYCHSNNLMFSFFIYIIRLNIIGIANNCNLTFYTKLTLIKSKIISTISHRFCFP